MPGMNGFRSHPPDQGRSRTPPRISHLDLVRHAPLSHRGADAGADNFINKADFGSPELRFHLIDNVLAERNSTLSNRNTVSLRQEEVTK